MIGVAFITLNPSPTLGFETVGTVNIELPMSISVDYFLHVFFVYFKD